MAKLLVSVRSAKEAALALRSGADIIDVKEPRHGPLGRASVRTWRDVFKVVGDAAPVSVALGEYSDWPGDECLPRDTEEGAAVSYYKLGLAGAVENWHKIGSQLWTRSEGRSTPAWIAVIYADWRAARAPHPEEILDRALRQPFVAGVLVDTWSKGGPARLGPEWRPRLEPVRRSGKLLALAGGVTTASVPALGVFSPDIIAVRGAACIGGDRLDTIDPNRVAEIAMAARALGHQPPASSQFPTSNRTPWASGNSLP